MKIKKTKNKNKNGKNNSVLKGYNLIPTSKAFNTNLSMNKRKTRNRSTNLKVSECALKFGMALKDPFSLQARGACIPTLPSKETFKQYAQTAVTMVVGSSGYGHFLLTPAVSNISPQCVYTNSATAGYGSSANPTLVSGGGLSSGWATTTLPLVFGASAFSSGTTDSETNLQGKIVSVGVKVRYTGTVMNCGGLITSYSSPTHADLWGIAPATLNNYVGVRRYVIKPGVTYIQSSGPSCEDDLDFPSAALRTGTTTLEYLQPWSGGLYLGGTAAGFDQYAVAASDSYGPAPIVFSIQSTPGNTFDVEFCMNVEYTGATANFLATPNVADPVGTSTMMTAASYANELLNSNPEKSIETVWKTALNRVGEELMPVAIGALTNGIKNMLKY